MPNLIAPKTPIWAAGLRPAETAAFITQTNITPTKADWVDERRTGVAAPGHSAGDPRFGFELTARLLRTPSRHLGCGQGIGTGGQDPDRLPQAGPQSFSIQFSLILLSILML